MGLICVGLSARPTHQGGRYLLHVIVKHALYCGAGEVGAENN